MLGLYVQELARIREARVVTIIDVIVVQDRLGF